MLKKYGVFLLIAVSLISCSTTASDPGEATEIPLPTEPEPLPALTFDIPDTEIPLAEPGPYGFSMILEILYHDEQREGREVSISIFYPSIDDQPDLRGAPFPLIINDYKMFYKFGSHLASHGFIVAGINNIDTGPFNEYLYDQPLDYVVVLDQLANSPPEVLEGIIDTDHVGVWGYSYGANNSVFLSGGRFDPEYYFGYCETPGEAGLDHDSNRIEFECGPYKNWDNFAGQAGPEITVSEDGLWQPITDDRIIAAIPMSASVEWLFGPRGLSSVDKAVLLTGGTLEDPHYKATYRIFEELGTSEKAFISFVKQTHNMIDLATPTDQMRHLAVAFFSYHLKGYDEYAYYFSEEYISGVEDLAWGWYQE